MENPTNKDQGSWHATILDYSSQVYHPQQAVEICALRRISGLKSIVRVSLVSHWLDHDHSGKERSSLEQPRETIAAARTWPSGVRKHPEPARSHVYLKKHHPSSFAGGVLLGITLSPIFRDTCEQHALFADGARLASKFLGAEFLPLLTKGCLSFGSWRKGKQTVYALEKPRYPRCRRSNKTVPESCVSVQLPHLILECSSRRPDRLGFANIFLQYAACTAIRGPA